MTHRAFYNAYEQLFFDEDKAEILNLLEGLELSPIEDLQYLSEDDCRRLSSVDIRIQKFDAVKSSFLNQKEMDVLQAEMTDDAPY